MTLLYSVIFSPNLKEREKLKNLVKLTGNKHRYTIIYEFVGVSCQTKESFVGGGGVPDIE